MLNLNFSEFFFKFGFFTSRFNTRVWTCDTRRGTRDTRYCTQSAYLSHVRIFPFFLPSISLSLSRTRATSNESRLVIILIFYASFQEEDDAYAR